MTSRQILSDQRVGFSLHTVVLLLKWTFLIFSFFSGPHIVPDPWQPGAPGHDEQDPRRHSRSHDPPHQDQLLPVGPPDLGLDGAGRPVRVTTLPSAGPVPALRSQQPAGPGRDYDVGSCCQNVGVWSGLQAGPSPGSQTSIPGQIRQ